MKKINKGFTLIEVLIVTGIIAILATIADAGMDYYQRKRQRTEGAELIKNINTSEVAYRNSFGVYVNKDKLAAWAPIINNAKFTVNITVPQVGAYLEYTANITPNNTTIDPGCALYTLRVTGPLIEQKTYDTDSNETTGACLGK